MLRPKKELKPSPDLPPPPPIRDDAGKIPNHTPSRRWEELHVDCLANVFAKVGMESLLLALPFVCKLWYAASLNPLCWKFLHFPEFEPNPLFVSVHEIDFETLKFGPFYDKFIHEYRINRTRFSITGFIKLVTKRSQGKAISLKLPGFCSEEALRHVSDACPEIRMLYLCDDLVLFKHCRVISEVIGKWKLLEHLTLGGNWGEILKQYGGIMDSVEYLSKGFEALLSFDKFNGNLHKMLVHDGNLHEILVQVGIHCKNFMSFHIFETLLGENEALAIVNYLPGLMELTLGQCSIERDDLVMLLMGCKKLCCFNLWYCEGFEGCEAEVLMVLKLASHVGEFCYKGATNEYTRLYALKRYILTLGIKKQIWREARATFSQFREEKLCGSSSDSSHSTYLRF